MNFFKQTKVNYNDIKKNKVPGYEVGVLALQHMFAMFGATILVPLITGLSPAVALFTSGLGTIIFHLITKGKVPAYLGSSFVFIAPLALLVSKGNVSGAMAGVVVVGLIYVLMSILIKVIGTGFFRRLLPPVVIGPVIMTIGLGLASAIKSYVDVSPNVAKNMTEAVLFVRQTQHILTALITLGIVIGVYMFAKGIFKIIPILMGIIGGYLFAMTQGLVDFTPIQQAAWFAIPSFSFPQFSGNLQAITLIAPLAIATMVEHLGDIEAIGRTTKNDFIKKPGLHRTLMGDGIATIIAGLFGGPPNTTYGENTGVLALTKVHNPFIILMTAIIVFCFSFIGKFGALIQTVPTPVIGGISILLFGLIASIGLRTLRENNVDLNNNRNLVIISVILILALSGIEISFWQFSFNGMGLGAIIGVILNLILPKNVNI